jgi:ferredoxin
MVSSGRMKVIVDLDVCEAHGDCVVVAPEVFDLGEDDDVVTVVQAEPGEELRAKVESAVDSCPVAAIRIED